MRALAVCLLIVVSTFVAGASDGFVSGRATLDGTTYSFASHPTAVPPGFLRIESGGSLVTATPTCLAVNGSTATAGFRVVMSDNDAAPVGSTVHLFLWDQGKSNDGT